MTTTPSNHSELPVGRLTPPKRPSPFSAASDESTRAAKKRKIVNSPPPSIVVIELHGSQDSLMTPQPKPALFDSGHGLQAMVLLYEKFTNFAEGLLSHRIRGVNPQNHNLKQYFDTSSFVASELGNLASNLFWKVACEVETDLHLNESILQTITPIVEGWDYQWPDAKLDSPSLSHKLLRLITILTTTCLSYGAEFCGVVYVRQPIISLLLLKIFQQMTPLHETFSPCVFIGHGAAMNIDQQESIFSGFASKSYNLMFATHSTQDLGVPATSAVIYFDLPENSQAYHSIAMHSRSFNGHLLHLLEADCKTQRHHLSLLHKEGGVAPSLFIATPKPLFDVGEVNQGEILLDSCFQFLEDPASGGRLYIYDILHAIHYLSPSGSQTQKPQFEYLSSSGNTDTISSTFFVPGFGPSRSFTSPPSASRASAHREACFMACAALLASNLLPHAFFRCETGEPELYALSHKPNMREYPRRQPRFWRQGHSPRLDRLFSTIVQINTEDSSVPGYMPFLILTRHPFPHISPFSLFPGGTLLGANFVRAEAFELGTESLHQLSLYSERIFRAISNKRLTCEPSAMMYFLAPLSSNSPRSVGIQDQIQWDVVTRVAENRLTPLDWTSPQKLAEDLEDAVIQDRWIEFTRRFYVERMRTDLSPLSPVHDVTAFAQYENIFEFCKSRRKELTELKDYNQPLIQLNAVPPPQSYLIPSAPSEINPTNPRYFIPELCAKSPIPARVLRTALLFPSIFRRVDEILVVKELNGRLFNNTISETLLHMAVSAPSLGAEYNYERLEFLGDAVLKYISSIYVFVAHPMANEGALHTARAGIISNKALMKAAIEAGLPGYIQAKPFQVRSWLPPHFYVTKEEPGLGIKSGEQIERTDGLQVSSEETGGEVRKAQSDSKKVKGRKIEAERQSMGDKLIADVTEAIIGAAYLTGGVQLALSAVKSLRIPISGVECWDDFRDQALTPPASVTIQLPTSHVLAVEDIIGHTFSHRHMLSQALTHSSIQGYDFTSYERLEFIGDAVLEFLTVRYIYDRDPQLAPGRLTVLKSAMVSNQALAALCVSSKLYKYLSYASPILTRSIQDCVEQLKAKQVEEDRHSREHNCVSGQYWREIDPPKVLSDVVESLLGAVFLSDAFETRGVEQVFEKIIKPFFSTYLAQESITEHPTKTLFEGLQAYGCKEFEIIKEMDGPKTCCMVLIHDTILATAKHQNPNTAARFASSFAQDALSGDDDFLARTCTCVAQRSLN